MFGLTEISWIGRYRQLVRAIAAAVCVLACMQSSASGQEIVVKNDNLPDNPVGPQAVGILGYFNSNEEVNVWLTAPCDGKIVAVDVLWMASSPSGPSLPSVEDSIIIYQPGTFPTRSNTPLFNEFPTPTTGAVLEGPAMQGNGIHEFRFLDENSTVPLSVPVTSGQTFVVSFRFGVDHSNNYPGDPAGTPTIPIDLNGCTAQRNGIFGIPGGFINWCGIPTSGDFVVRVKMVCGATTGACCIAGVCSQKTSADCAAQGGTFTSLGTACGANTCNGACCVPATQQCALVSAATCAAFSGVFQGLGTNCNTTVCFPMGACCLEDGSCSAGPMSPAACTALGGTFAGHNSTCATANCQAPMGACCAGSICAGATTQAACAALGGTWAYPASACGTFTCPYCPADITHDGGVNVTDLLAVITAWGPCNNCPADIAPPPFGNNQVNVADLLLIITTWGACH